MSTRFEQSELFDDVRAAHRSEPTPKRLKRSSLERFEAGERGAPPEAPWRDRWRLVWELHRRSAAVVAAASVGALLLWFFAQANGAGELAVGAGAPAPESPSDETPSAERGARSPRATSRSGQGAPDPVRPCPRQPSDEARTDATPRLGQYLLEGVTEHFLRVAAGDCPPLTRRYLERLPDALPARASVPVMIVFHDTGLTPEQARIETRWYFEALAREKRFILIYASAANAVPAPRPPGAAGATWQTDDGADPAIDDALYVERIGQDLASRGVIAGGNGVWLVGSGGGATLALTLAAQSPTLYTGVAAIEPTRVDIDPPTPSRQSRLERVLFAAQGKPEEVWGTTPLQGLAQRWALALGVHGRDSGQPPVRYSRQGKVGHFDLANGSSQGPSVRVVTFDPGVDAFPPPGAVDPAMLAELRQRPGFINGADQIWQYLNEAPTPR